jgi:hypothetical protein
MAKGRSADAADDLEPVEVEYTIEIAARGGRWRAVIEDLEVEFEGRSRTDAVSQIQGRAFAALASRIKGGGIALPGPLRLVFVVRDHGDAES